MLHGDDATCDNNIKKQLKTYLSYLPGILRGDEWRQQSFRFGSVPIENKRLVWEGGEK